MPSSGAFERDGPEQLPQRLPRHGFDALPLGRSSATRRGPTPSPSGTCFDALPLGRSSATDYVSKLRHRVF